MKLPSQGKVPNSDSSILTITASKNHKKYVDKDSIKNFSDRLQVDEKSTFKVVNYAKNSVFFEIRGHQKHLYLTSFAYISTFSTVFGHGEHFLSVFRKSWKFWKKLIFWAPMARLFQAAISLCQLLFFDHFWYSGFSAMGNSNLMELSSFDFRGYLYWEERGVKIMIFHQMTQISYFFTKKVHIFLHKL